MQISQRHIEAVELLSRGASTGQVAAHLKVNERTVRKWLAEPTFAELLDRAQGEMIKGLARRLRVLGSKAAATLSSVMADTTAAPSARVSAAGRVLDALFRLDEMAKLDLIERRLTEIETRLMERGRV